jgi:3',5'-cyclic AMP phosphodiesterase CpdA
MQSVTWHLAYRDNRRALMNITPHPKDWLIVAGDIGETAADLEFAYEVLTPRFRRLVWVPGNHELWTRPASGEQLRGLSKYERLPRFSIWCGTRRTESWHLRFKAL